MTDSNNFAIMMAKLEEAFTRQMEFTKPFNFKTLEFDAEHVCLQFVMQNQFQGNIRPSAKLNTGRAYARL